MASLGTCGILLAYVLGIASAESPIQQAGSAPPHVSHSESASSAAQTEPGDATAIAEAADAADTSGPGSPGMPQNSQALHYAQAVQDGDCDTVIAMTQWMQERLQKVRLQTGSPTDIEAARRSLCQRLSRRQHEHAFLRPEGVEDSYLFAPGATLSIVGMDEGDPSLGDPVRERTWISVEYASRSSALRDAAGRPIRSLRAGVNIGPDGRVVKAGILGNVNIDAASILYDWPNEHTAAHLP